VRGALGERGGGGYDGNVSDPRTPVAAASLDELCDALRARFKDCYGPGAAPRVFFAPGRVSLFGGHLDYNGGPVMPMALDRGTLVALRPRNDRRVRMASDFDSKGIEVELDRPPDSPLGRWVDYPLGVLREMVALAPARGADGVGSQGLVGLDIMYGGNLPIGAGLSSSASMCVATALALDMTWGLGLSGRDRVETALSAERNFVGVQCGIMDPFAVGLARPGHLLWLDCRDVTWEHLPVDMDRLVIAVANTGIKRELASGEFNKRVAQCAEAFRVLQPFSPGATCLRDIPLDVVQAEIGRLDPVVAKRATHVAEEVLRVFEARALMVAGEFAKAGATMTQTHRSLRENYEVSCPELNLFVEAATAQEACYGSRLTGAGFGGCTVILLDADGADEAISEMSKRVEQELGRVPSIECFGGDEGPRELFA
jgi:galactokinase